MFVRKMPTASRAMAVQVAEHRGGRDKVLKHIGSAHNEEELALLVTKAREFIHPGQLTFDLDALESPSQQA